jgi:hypothetical protein
MAYYVVYAPDDTVTAISIFNDYARAEESNRQQDVGQSSKAPPLPCGTCRLVSGRQHVHARPQPEIPDTRTSNTKR